MRPRTPWVKFTVQRSQVQCACQIVDYGSGLVVLLWRSISLVIAREICPSRQPHSDIGEPLCFSPSYLPFCSFLVLIQATQRYPTVPSILRTSTGVIGCWGSGRLGPGLGSSLHNGLRRHFPPIRSRIFRTPTSTSTQSSSLPPPLPHQTPVPGSIKVIRLSPAASRAPSRLPI